MHPGGPDAYLHQPSELVFLAKGHLFFAPRVGQRPLRQEVRLARLEKHGEMGHILTLAKVTAPMKW